MGVSKLKTARLFGFSVFFFQAEDGIRDVAVTGVQTCALPISLAWRHRLSLRGAQRRSNLPAGGVRCLQYEPAGACAARCAMKARANRGSRCRSGEGRVGEEGRSRGAPDHLKKKKKKKGGVRGS